MNRIKKIDFKALFMITAIAGASILLMSCATEMSTRATRVRLVSVEKLQDVEKSCEFVANVQGQSYPLTGCLCWWCVARDVAHNNALNELLDNAAEVGATHVFINPGDYPDLRGVAYSCTYCEGPDGQPDTDYCMMPDGDRDISYCQDAEGKIIGLTHCEGAEGDTQSQCLENGGIWIQAIDETSCKEQGHTWIPEAKDRKTCENKGGIWYPRAEDQITCEEVKGGKWKVDEDVMRRLPTTETLGGGQ